MARQTASYLMKKQRMQKRVQSAKSKFRDLGIPAKWKEVTPKKFLPLEVNKKRVESPNSVNSLLSTDMRQKVILLDLESSEEDEPI